MFNEHIRHISKLLQLPVYNPLSVRLPYQHPLCTFSSPMLATCPAHPTLDLIPAKVQHFVYRTHHKTPHYAVSSSLLSPGPLSAHKVFLSTLSSNTLCLYPSRNMTPNFTPIRNTMQNYRSEYSAIFVFGYQS